MNMKTIKFPSNTWFTGRNGMSNASGIQITESFEGHLTLVPVTSKGKLANCFIVVHKGSVPEFIASIGPTVPDNKEPVLPTKAEGQPSTYVLFGKEAVNILQTEGFKRLNRTIKADKTSIGFALKEFTQGDTVADILSAADGWDDWAILTPDQYKKLSVL